MGNGRLYQPTHHFHHRHIPTNPHTASARRSHNPACRRLRCHLINIIEQHRRPRRHQLPRNLPPNTHTRPRHNRHFAGKIVVLHKIVLKT